MHKPQPTTRSVTTRCERQRFQQCTSMGIFLEQAQPRVPQPCSDKTEATTLAHLYLHALLLSWGKGKVTERPSDPNALCKSLCKKHVFAFSFNHATALLGKVLALTTLILNYFKSCIQVQVHKYLLYTFPLSEKPFHFHPPRNGLIHNLERRKPVILNWRGGGRNNNNNNKNHTDKRSTQLCMVTEDWEKSELYSNYRHTQDDTLWIRNATLK